MKKVTIILTGVILMALNAINVNAQNTASVEEAQAQATVIMPIAITNPTILNFGNLISSSVAGTVELAVDGTRTATAGVTLPSAIPGTITAAEFIVTGENNATFSLSISPSVVLKNAANNEMILNAFVENSDEVISDTGSETFNVGGTLNVNAGQQSGVYTGTYNVTVTYN